MNDVDVEALFRQNADQIQQMNPAAAGLVSSLIDELERAGRETYIRLRNPAPDGHTVEYEFVKGDRHLVTVMANLLGFKSVTESRLEVRSG